jgi:hypothetical protein
MKIIYAFLPLCLLAQGCIGFAVNKSQTRTFREPLLTDTASCGSVYERITSLKELKEEQERTKQDLSWRTNQVVYTSAWLKTHWGTPTSITRSGADSLDEMWTYKFDVIWEGIEPFIVVPIPLEVPVRREAIRFVMRDGHVISVGRIEPSRVGGVAGLLLSPDRPYFGVSSLTTE